MINVRVEAPRLRDALGRFRRVDEAAEEALNWAVSRATETVYRQARANVRVKFNTSGRMENAIKMVMKHAGKVPVGEVFVRGREYTVHETGSRGSYLIRPRFARALRFAVENGSRFSAWARRGPLPQRPFLTIALEQSRGRLREIFAEARDRMVRRSGP